MLTLLSALVALGCLLASARRLAWAVAPTSLDGPLLLQALAHAGPDALPSLAGAVEVPSWEHDVLEALAQPDAPSREALLVEQLLELDWRAQRWARVPRVCASIATSGGFLCASIALLQGLALPADDFAVAAGAALVSAVNALAVGIAGTTFCVAVHLRAQRLARERRASSESLVDRLSALRDGGSELRG